MTKSTKQPVVVDGQQQQRYLGDDVILDEILTRLPIKSILRFKSVSKQWHSTLSSTNFAKAHLMKSAFSDHPSAPVDTLFIHNVNDNDYYLFSYDDDQVSGSFKDNLVKQDVDLGPNKRFKLTGCCNGLVCLTEAFNKYFVLWNPATRKMYKYVSSDSCLKKHFRVNINGQSSTGFGYVSSVDDYKYVQILSDWWTNENVVLIFSLRENKWRKIECGQNNPLIIIYGRLAVNVDEKIYWDASGKGDSDLVVSFDLENEIFEINMIDGFNMGFLGVMGGRLSKCNCDEYGSYNRWDELVHILEPRATLLKSIGLPKGVKLDLNSQMIGFTKNGRFFVTGPSIDEKGFDIKTLGLVDVSTKPMQYTTLLKFDEPAIRIARYFPTLVSPSPMVKPSEA